jgi:hypothetical protein
MWGLRFRVERVCAVFDGVVDGLDCVECSLHADAHHWYLWSEGASGRESV